MLLIFYDFLLLRYYNIHKIPKLTGIIPSLFHSSMHFKCHRVKIANEFQVDDFCRLFMENVSNWKTHPNHKTYSKCYVFLTNKTDVQKFVRIATEKKMKPY